MTKQIRQYIYNICREVITNEIDEKNLRDLKATSDLAKLIIDAKNNKLSMESQDFLCRMNIHPELFNK